MNKFGILITRRFTSNFAYILGILSLEKKRIKFLARIDFSRAQKKTLSALIAFESPSTKWNHAEKKETDSLVSLILDLLTISSWMFHRLRIFHRSRQHSSRWIFFSILSLRENRRERYVARARARYNACKVCSCAVWRSWILLYRRDLSRATLGSLASYRFPWIELGQNWKSN